jgi:curved DNA-binding protein CbpA
MIEARDPYDVLRVAPDADQEAIRSAYRALARRFHPDRAGTAGHYRMSEINAAWEVLGDPGRRAAWDRARAAEAADPRSSRPAGREPSWVGAAGPPPGRPSGSVLTFGRHKGWSIGEIARVDPGYLDWLELRPEGRRYVEEIDQTLRRTGFRTTRPASSFGGRPRRRFGFG